jgi:hypothetical protein
MMAYNESIDKSAVECRDSAPVVEYGHGKKRVGLLEALPEEESDECEETCNDGRQRRSRVPWMLDASPGQSYEEAGHATNEDYNTDPIGMLKLLRQSEISDPVETNENDRNDEANEAEGEVDDEAPTPGRSLCEYTTD